MEQLICFINKNKYIFIVCGLILGLISVFLINSNHHEEEVITEISEINMEESNNDYNTIKINIKGAVVQPGVYEIPKNSRVEDAIFAAGGLIDNADTSIINLSRKLSDESVVIIYTVDEVKKIKQGNVIIQYIENECNCPEYQNSACIDPDTLINNDNDSESISGKISLNKATIEQLQTLSGIGKAKAEAIIEYRSINGGFKNIEEIKKVKGIGDAVFEKIKNDITI